MLRVYNICSTGLIFYTALPRTFGIPVSAVIHRRCIKGSPELRLWLLLCLYLLNFATARP